MIFVVLVSKKHFSFLSVFKLNNFNILEAETINYQGVKMVFAISTFKLCFPNKAVLRQILRRIEEKVLNDAKKGVSKFLESFSSQH